MNATAIHRPRPGLPGRGPDEAGIRLAVEVMLLPLALLRSRLGRRLLVAATFALVLTTAVAALYDSADVPARAAGRAGSLQRTAAEHTAKAGDRRAATAVPARELGRRPEDVAADWFAQRQGVAREQVQALQQQKVSSTERRVLVMADAGNGRLPTGYVTVRRDGSGWSAG